MTDGSDAPEIPLDVHESGGVRTVTGPNADAFADARAGYEALGELIRIFETTDWQEVPEFGVGEAAVLTQRLISARDAYPLMVKRGGGGR